MTQMSGLVLMGISALSFSLMASVIKVLRMEGLPTGEIMFFRGLFCSALTVIALRSSRLPLIGRRRAMLALRGLLGLMGLYLYCEAIGRIPLADAMALQYSHPMFAALFAWLLLKERMPRIAPLALVICAGGGLIILNPQGTGDLDGNLIGLASGIVAGLAYTAVRSLGKTENPLCIMLAYHVATLLFGVVSLFYARVWPNGRTWLWIAALVITSQAGQWFLTNGLQREKAGVATTVGYTAIAWGVMFAWIFFGESASLSVVLGTLVMVAGLCLLARR